MRLLEFAILYFLIGGGAALAAWRTIGGALDGALLLFFWPIYGPTLLFSRAGAQRGIGQEAAFLSALQRAQGTPLVALLPSAEEARNLARRVRVAARKVEEIDEALRRPEFSEDGARKRLLALTSDHAGEASITAASLRLQNIQRLQGLRDRFSRELDDVGELLSQLATQAEVVRLAGTADESSGALVRELLSRVEGLDQVLDDGGALATRPTREARPQAADTL